MIFLVVYVQNPFQKGLVDWSGGRLCMFLFRCRTDHRETCIGTSRLLALLVFSSRPSSGLIKLFRKIVVILVIFAKYVIMSMSRACFVPRSCHVDYHILHIHLPSLKFTIFPYFVHLFTYMSLLLSNSLAMFFWLLR